MRKKNPEKAALILEAARQLILQEGAAAVSTTKVARAVGIAQSNIYIYFKSKDDMLRQVYKDAQTRIQTYFVENQPDTTDIRPAIIGYIDCMYGFATHDFATFEVLHQIKAIPEAHWTREIADAQAPVALIRSGIETGILRPVAPAVHMSIVFNAVRQCVLSQKAGEVTDFAMVRDMLLAAVFMPD